MLQNSDTLDFKSDKQSKLLQNKTWYQQLQRHVGYFPIFMKQYVHRDEWKCSPDTRVFISSGWTLSVKTKQLHNSSFINWMTFDCHTWGIANNASVTQINSWTSQASSWPPPRSSCLCLPGLVFPPHTQRQSLQLVPSVGRLPSLESADGSKTSPCTP